MTPGGAIYNDPRLGSRVRNRVKVEVKEEFVSFVFPDCVGRIG